MLRTLIALLFSGMALILNSQSKQYDIRTVAFYNVENLFDTINDRYRYDNDFTPNGLYRYTSKIYWDKIAKLSQVIAQIGVEEHAMKPVIIGLCEVETRGVLVDLIRQKALKQVNYEIIHYDSPDERGIDVALLYQKQHFKEVKHQVFALRLLENDGRTDSTRDQLVVSGLLDGDPLYFIINHWPSRRGGALASAPKRIAAAKLSMRLIDSIREFDHDAKILLMGDFNDDPDDRSLRKTLDAKANKHELTTYFDLYNPMAVMHRKGFNTLVYRDNVNLFDQIILSQPLLDQDFSSYRFYKAGIFNKDFMIKDYGRYKGYPYRSFEQTTYIGGYSDHFPVFVYLIRRKR